MTKDDLARLNEMDLVAWTIDVTRRHEANTIRLRATEDELTAISLEIYRRRLDGRSPDAKPAITTTDTRSKP